MAGDYIPLMHSTPDKARVYAIGQRLKALQRELSDADWADLALGKLVRAWLWADSQSSDGKIEYSGREMLDSVTRCEGFAAAMESVDWLECNGRSIEFTEFGRYNTNTAKSRLNSAKRVNKHRLLERLKSQEPDEFIQRRLLAVINSPNANDQQLSELVGKLVGLKILSEGDVARVLDSVRQRRPKKIGAYLCGAFERLLKAHTGLHIRDLV